MDIKYYEIFLFRFTWISIQLLWNYLIMRSVWYKCTLKITFFCKGYTKIVGNIVSCSKYTIIIRYSIILWYICLQRSVKCTLMFWVTYYFLGPFFRILLLSEDTKNVPWHTITLDIRAFVYYCRSLSTSLPHTLGHNGHQI